MAKIFLLLLALGSAAFAKAQINKDEKEIMGLLNRQIQSWNNGNLEAFMDGYWHNDSLMFIGKSGVTYGYANTLNNYRKNYGDSSRMGRLFFQVLKIKPLSPMYYWVLGKWFLKRSAGDAGGHYTLLLKKISGKWQIIADHSS